MGSNDPNLRTEYQDEYIKKPTMERPKMMNDLRLLIMFWEVIFLII